MGGDVRGGGGLITSSSAINSLAGAASVNWQLTSGMIGGFAIAITGLPEEQTPTLPVTQVVHPHVALAHHSLNDNVQIWVVVEIVLALVSDRRSVYPLRHRVELPE